MFLAKKHQSLHVASLLEAFDAGHTVVHKAGSPGIGKTFIIFLLAKMLKARHPEKVIYVATINDYLVE